MILLHGVQILQLLLILQSSVVDHLPEVHLAVDHLLRELIPLPQINLPLLMLLNLTEEAIPQLLILGLPILQLRLIQLNLVVDHLLVVHLMEEVLLRVPIALLLQH
jgi:hypothetical protein